jgi:hypothetical protein
MAAPIIESFSAAAVIVAIAVAAMIVPVPRQKPEVEREPPVVEENAEVSLPVPMVVAPAPPPVPHLETPEHIEDVERVQVIHLQVIAAKKDVIEIAKSLRERAGPEDVRR